MTQTENRARNIAQRVNINNAIVTRSDAYLLETETIAESMVEANLKNTQIKGLQTLAYTTDKISDVVDWIKIRVGRDEKRNGWAKNSIGSELLRILYQELREDANKIVEELGETAGLPEEPQRQIHLRLIREYLTHVAAHFEYMKALRNNL